jgi:hypothetical protein
MPDELAELQHRYAMAHKEIEQMKTRERTDGKIPVENNRQKD